jgi:MOSC domain-containing protein YiiM
LKILSIQTGTKKEIIARGKPWPTAIFKSQVTGPIYLGPLGLEGDEQAHENVHGGEGRALYAISREAYDFWQQLVPREVPLAHGAFGENVTLSTLNEKEIEVGDTFSLGETELQATMPRFPCLLFAARMQLEDTAQKIMRVSDHPGILFRVLKPGFLNVGDRLTPLKRFGSGLTITDFLKMTIDDKMSHADFNRVKELGLMPDKTIERLAYRLT